MNEPVSQEKQEKPASRSRGVARWVSAFKNSLSALTTGWKTETAMREEMLLVLVAIPLALLLGDTPGETVAMIVSVLFILLVEVLNTAIEATLDRISDEIHPLTKIGKDMGSLAVLIALVIAALVWGAALL
ncbi:MAG: diacylglycerol kinase [Alphaproteobacteria bacterium]|nr:MAG: diacylglycerol kinase [Alphaproteobacteria bacterium]